MKTYKELQDDIEFEKTLDDLVEFKLISKAQRRKIALRMKKLVKTAAFKKKVERSKRKIANFAKQKVLDKFNPKYKEMSLAARVKIDQILQQKHGSLINKMTQKLGRVVKKKEIEKVRKAREVKQDDK